MRSESERTSPGETMRLAQIPAETRLRMSPGARAHLWDVRIYDAPAVMLWRQHPLAVLVCCMSLAGLGFLTDVDFLVIVGAVLYSGSIKRRDRVLRSGKWWWFKIWGLGRFPSRYFKYALE